MKEEYVLQKIRQLLDERRWTLYRLAKEAEISYSTLSNTFQRNNVPSVSTLIKVCDGFGITMSDFFDEDGVKIQQLTASDQKLLADFHRLVRDDKKLVVAYMQGLLKITEFSELENEKGKQEEAGMDQEEPSDSDSGQ